MLLEPMDMTMGNLQGHLNSIYGPINQERLNDDKLVIRLLSRMTKMSKGVRKNDKGRIQHNISLTFSWAMAFANYRGFSAEHQLLLRYPDCCPYCGAKPCVCTPERRPDRVITKTQVVGLSGKVYKIQEMLKGIYPQNTLLSSTLHLVEEIGELGLALQDYQHFQTYNYLEKVKEEYVDVIANLFGVATCAGIDFADIMFFTYRNGCPSCGHPICTGGRADEVAESSA